MEPTDLIIQILKSIRDEVSSVRTELGARIDVTNHRLDETNQRLDVTNERLESFGDRVVESEMRPATAIIDLHGTVRELVDVMRSQHDLRPRTEPSSP
jgi:hypothetical protein